MNVIQTGVGPNFGFILCVEAGPGAAADLGQLAAEEANDRFVSGQFPTHYNCATDQLAPGMISVTTSVTQLTALLEGAPTLVLDPSPVSREYMWIGDRMYCLDFFFARDTTTSTYPYEHWKVMGSDGFERELKLATFKKL